MTNTITLYDSDGNLMHSPRPIDYMFHTDISFDDRLNYVETNHNSISEFFENYPDSELFFISLWNEETITPETKRSIMPYFNQLFDIWLNRYVDHDTRILTQLLDNQSSHVELVFKLLRSYIYDSSIKVHTLHILATLCVTLDMKRTLRLLKLNRLYSVFYQDIPHMYVPKTSTLWLKSGKTYTVKNVNLNTRTNSFIEHINELHGLC